MKFVPDSVSRNVARKLLTAKKNSPHIFFAAGVAGVVTGTVMACRATLKLEETLDEIKQDFVNVKELGKNKEQSEEYTQEEYYKDLGYVYAKGVLQVARLYGPSFVVGVISVAALTGSHVQLTRRNAALASTVAVVSKAFDNYRERVREELGLDKELDIYHNAKEEYNPETSEISKVVDPGEMSPYARFFDECSPNWIKNSEMNRIFIQMQQNYANHQLKARGHVFLNEVYDSLGLERSQAGAVVGWIYNGDGDNYIDFGLFEARNARFVNGIERSILLDFNVDGVIYDLI